jgi:type IV secretory pathway VirB10-like protein
MAPTKTACKNSEKFSYTGKEMSPLGMGFCADAESVGTEMSGRDGKTWIVGVKNNDKIWMRAPEKPLAPEEPVMTKEPEGEPSEPKPEPTTPEKPKKKTTKKPKAETPTPEPTTPDQPIQPSEEPQTPVKPKRKYTKKSKTTDETPTDDTTNNTKPEKKERKKRGPSGYNLFIGKAMKEQREKVPGLKTTDYMKHAQEAWGAMSKEEQKTLTEQLKAALTAEIEA